MSAVSKATSTSRMRLSAADRFSRTPLNRADRGLQTVLRSTLITARRVNGTDGGVQRSERCPSTGLGGKVERCDCKSGGRQVSIVDHNFLACVQTDLNVRWLLQFRQAA